MQDEYPEANFLRLDGEPHDASYTDYKTASNVHSVLYQEDRRATSLAMRPLRTATPDWASWAVWPFLQLSVMATASCRARMTRMRLGMRACGEHPQAADSAGINVYRMRYPGVCISGMLAGVGGFAFTVAAGSGFQSTVAGYGFLALAVMIFGNWKPLSILGASVFFAFFKIIGSYSGSISFLPRFESVKSSEYIYLMLPYVVTMILLVLT